MKEEQKQAILMCRAFGHAWDIAHGETWDPKIRWLDGVRIVIRCTNGCGTLRRDVWNRWDGSLLYREYIYVEGYKDAVPETPENFSHRAWARVVMAEVLFNKPVRKRTTKRSN